MPFYVTKINASFTHLTLLKHNSIIIQDLGVLNLK